MKNGIKTKINTVKAKERDKGGDWEKERPQAQVGQNSDGQNDRPDPEAEGYPAWAALPLMFSFLRSSQISRAEDSA